MNILPIEINFNTLNNLYENRHLFTDDVQYNSLVVSNIIGINIVLLDILSYNNFNLELKSKMTNNNNCILTMDGLNHITQHPLNNKSIILVLLRWCYLIQNPLSFYNRHILTIVR